RSKKTRKGHPVFDFSKELFQSLCFGHAPPLEAIGVVSLLSSEFTCIFRKQARATQFLASQAREQARATQSLILAKSKQGPPSL
ncbi:hypothetical protein, partial [Novipirellula herctigrandis]|uniref:hypothetical protein n=1 Tax=Novipirellula herctigrandis TaxID=2527986 RepID=UPI003AF3435E